MRDDPSLLAAAAAPDRPRRGQIVTFYSYKGGVGRSMALANIAVLLVQRGQRVLIVDWDLEAPGLDRYFRSYLSSPSDPPAEAASDGLLTLLEEARQDAPPESYKHHLCAVRLPEPPEDSSPPGSKRGAPGTLALLPSGEADPDYPERLARFSWSEFYSRHGGEAWLERLRLLWQEDFDFVLLDSRTGVTDASGICTIHLPDRLVFILGTNAQNLEGSERIIEGIHTARHALLTSPPRLSIFPILSRFDGRNELDLAAVWLQRCARTFAPCYEDWLERGISAAQIIERTKLPHIAHYTFGEDLAVLRDSHTDPEQLPIQYNAIATILAHGGTVDAELLFGTAGADALRAEEARRLAEDQRRRAAEEQRLREMREREEQAKAAEEQRRLEAERQREQDRQRLETLQAVEMAKERRHRGRVVALATVATLAVAAILAAGFWQKAGVQRRMDELRHMQQAFNKERDAVWQKRAVRLGPERLILESIAAAYTRALDSKPEEAGDLRLEKILDESARAENKPVEELRALIETYLKEIKNRPSATFTEQYLASTLTGALRNEFIANGQSFLAKGEFLAAEERFRRALRELDQQRDREQWFRATAGLADSLRGQKKAGAELEVRRSLFAAAKETQPVGRDNIGREFVLSLLAANRVEEAASIVDALLGEVSPPPGESDENGVNRLRPLGEALAENNAPALAERVFRKLFAICQRLPDQYPTNLPSIVSSLTTLLAGQKQRDEARKILATFGDIVSASGIRRDSFQAWHDLIEVELALKLGDQTEARKKLPDLLAQYSAVDPTASSAAKERYARLPAILTALGQRDKAELVCRRSLYYGAHDETLHLDVERQYRSLLEARSVPEPEIAEKIKTAKKALEPVPKE